MSFGLERPAGQRPSIRTSPTSAQSAAPENPTPSMNPAPNDRARASAPLARCSLRRAPQLGNSAPLICRPLPSKLGSWRLFACGKRYTHTHDRTRKVMTFFPHLPPVWDACAHIAPSAVTRALDALLFRKVEATTTHLIATSHNTGRTLTLCSRAHSERAGEQAEGSRGRPTARGAGLPWCTAWPCTVGRQGGGSHVCSLESRSHVRRSGSRNRYCDGRLRRRCFGRTMAAKSPLLRELGLWGPRGRRGVLQCHRAHFPHSVLAP